MKIAITTIQNSSNYGAMLQTYALQEFLKDKGHQVSIVNYDNRFMSKGLDQIRHGLSKFELYYMLIDIMNYVERKNMIQKFHEFSSTKLCLSKLMSKEELLEGNKFNDYDLFISGSDQIWNPNVTNNTVDEVYFCGMAPQNANIISYSSSLGGYDFTNEEMNLRIKEYLEKYKMIAVRENSYIPRLTKLTNKEIYKVLDPVFLLNKNEWIEKFDLSDTCNGDSYVLIYAMSKHNDVIDLVQQKYGKTKKIKIIYQPLFRKKNIEYIVDAGPKEFIELFLNAERIVTNSFHGLAFGLIFNKQVSVLDNARNMNRIYDLLNSLGLTEVLSSKSQLTCTSIDYCNVKPKLEELINKSKKYLNEGLKW
ncbi:MAG: polysaccharide pyruvyl transferase family protein [Erysipelotrichales bacterium]|nr:polysaccharide pyruvyl transferase family protein [Erysipelotrichales bacterium]